MSVVKYTDPDGNVWADYKSYKLLELKLDQAMGVLGYPVPGQTPESDLKCGLCECKERDLLKSEVKAQTLFSVIRIMSETNKTPQG